MVHVTDSLRRLSNLEEGVARNFALDLLGAIPEEVELNIGQERILISWVLGYAHAPDPEKWKRDRFLAEVLNFIYINSQPFKLRLNQ